MLRVIYNSQTYWATGIYNAVSAGNPGILVGVRLFLSGGGGLSDPIPVSDLGLTIIGGGSSGGGLDAEAVQDLMATVITAGSGVTVTYNDAANTITIAATGGGSLTDEQIDDRVAALIQAGSGITATYNDAANTLTIAATAGAGLTLEEVQDNLGTAFIAPGAGISVTYNDALNLLTIGNTAPFSEEAIDDRVAALIQAGSGITATYNDAANTLTIAATAQANPLPRNFIQGCECRPNTNNPTTHLDILDGTVWIANAGRTSEFLRTIPGLTKRVNANWAAGGGQGGVFTGAALVANTWYEVHALFNPTTQATDFGFSTVAAGGTDAPVGWLTRRIAYIRSNASSELIGFSQVGRYFQWTTPVLDVNNVVNVPTVATLYPLTVPPYRRRANFQGIYFGNSYEYVWISSPFVADLAPDVNTARISLQPGSGASAGSVSPYGNFTLLTDDSGRIRVRASVLNADNALRILTLGWEDDRNWDFA